MAKITCEVVNQKGMHARAAAKIVAQVNLFESQVTLSHGDRQAPGDSLIKLLTLNAPKGSFITIDSQGPDTKALLDAMQALFASGFGE